MYASFLFGLAMAQLTGISTVGSKFIGVIGGGSAVVVVGIVDDFFCLSPVIKLSGQVVAATVLVLANHATGVMPLTFGTCATALLLVVSMTNASNLIDGLDGLCAGMTLISLPVLFAVAVGSSAHATMILSLVLWGSILGFLRFNSYPATIILGDCGSLFIGFVLAAGVLDLVNTHRAAGYLVLPLLSYALPLSEIASSIARRIATGRPVFKPDRGHIHYRLQDWGFGHNGAVLALYGTNGALTTGCLLLLLHPALLLVWIVAVSAAIPIVIGTCIGQQRKGNLHTLTNPEAGQVG